MIDVTLLQVEGKVESALTLMQAHDVIYASFNYDL